MEKAIAKRENGNLIKDGFAIPFDNRWVARKLDGTYLDHDRYFLDLKGRLKAYDIEKVGE